MSTENVEKINVRTKASKIREEKTETKKVRNTNTLPFGTRIKNKGEQSMRETR